MDEVKTVVALFGRHQCPPRQHWSESACGCIAR
jgi:hypothetical protein